MLRISSAVLAAVTAATSFSVSAEAKELKFASFVSSKYVLHKPVFEQLGKDMAKATGGAVTIRVYPSGELGRGAAEQYKRAATGIADLAMGVPGYTSSLMPRTLIIELPGVTTDNNDATKKLWKVMGKHLRSEYKRTVVLGSYTTAPAVLMMRTKPIRSPEDLKGMKIRVPSRVAGDVIKAYGGTPVQMSATKVYTSLATGVIDGILMGPSGLLLFKLNEPAKYVTYGLPAMVTAIYIVMNQKSFDGLTPSQQKALLNASGRGMSLRSAKLLDQLGTVALNKFAVAEGKQLIKVDAANFAKFDVLAKKVVASEVARLKGRGIAADSVLADMK